MRGRLAIAFLVWAVLQLPQTSMAGDVAVLVTNKACAMETITALDVRKAYLGINVRFEDQNIRIFRLSSDERLDEIFYQSIVAMSEKSYEKRLLLNLIKFGQPRPHEFDSVGELSTFVARSQCGIGYMWQTDAQAHIGLRVLKILWQEE